jgi:23S rRNA (pseudouridine1915-N3)-methyltransferase
VLKIAIIVVDRTRSPFLAAGEEFYLNRLQKYAHIEWIETKPAKIKKGRTTQDILTEEEIGILRNLPPQHYVIALDRAGKSYDSEGLASQIERLSVSHSRLGFIIGGPLGLSNRILADANEIFSLSRLTLTHEMSRLLLLEQLYRAFTIIHHEKYHK